MTKTTRASAVKSDPFNSNTPAVRYQIERSWRQIRNGGSAAAAGGQNSQLSVGLGLIASDCVKPRGQLAEHEKRNCRGNANVSDETR